MNDKREIPQSSSAPDEQSEESRQEIAATAYHEAGHAVMAMVLGRRIQKVTISPKRKHGGRMTLGSCEIKKGRSKPSKDGLEDDVLILLAGMAAEARFTGQYCRQSASQDLHSARRLLESRASNERQLKRLERRLLDKTEHLLADACHVAAIDLIANELIQKRTISGRAARHFFNQTLQQRSKK